MSETYPTLSVEPVTLRETRRDPSLRSSAEDGQVISRRKFTGDKKKFEIGYDNMPVADKVLLIAMQDTVGVGADTILWTNNDPNDATTYTVRLESPIDFTIKPSDYSLWLAKLILIED